MEQETEQNETRLSDESPNSARQRNKRQPTTLFRLIIIVHYLVRL